ncbi:Aste57867_2763 [Aphanomyces stellatus]|uniref:Aste57867_2763 protein n=1 Tax=Aphanomyces stellatus TaxID=120398 RepID=A0A485K9W4_9STRA|nr:hypothetical protein As57867_002756 [Aphanomyces stellatus]VFT79953.1 Aste57867_2763 [Aphanomyces stellatus]
MEERGLEASGTMCFHGVEYSVYMWVQSEELHVQVEEQSLKGGSESDRWGAHFPSLYIEELTKKTGNFKRFYTFVNMLMSALNHKSESVFIDLLTYSDLELYRKRKMGKSTATHHIDSATMLNNKRYLILTYAVEFDRVHYPLPLNYVETPSPAMLQKTIRRLKQLLADTRTTDGNPHMDKKLVGMQEENASLRLRLQQLEDIRSVQEDGSAIQVLKSELQAAVKENKEILALYQQLRKESAKEIQALQDELTQLRAKPDELPDDSRYVQRIRQLEKELERSAGDQARLSKELRCDLETTAKELNSTKSTVQDLQLKNRELLRQLAILRTKSSSSTTTQSTRPAAATVPLPKRRSHAPPSPSSDSEDDHSVKKHFSQSDKPSSRFKRFDPTAYHQERQQKLRARSQSPKPPQTPTRKAPRGSGYSSDSSATGGYQSGGSNSTRHSRPPRNTSAQREADARLSSPRHPRTARQRESDARLSSPRRTSDDAIGRRQVEPREGRYSSPRGRPKTTKKATAAMKRLTLGDESESDTPLQSFVDIDNRLNALQQFLKDAKQSKKDY